MSRCNSLLAAALFAGLLPGGCTGSEENKMRRKIAGDYVFEMNAGDVSVREVLTLRPDSRWTRVTALNDGFPETPDVMTDSGNYRIQGVNINLHSEVERGGVAMRYTVSGDTLFDANASLTYAVTGLDIGERIMVKER